MRHYLHLAALAVMFLLPTYSVAGSFRATPLKLFIDSKSKAATLRVTNEGDEKVTVQIDAKTWMQDDTGRDSYDETAEIVVFPKMVTLDKGETRLIRVGYNGTLAAQERSYRIFVQELPVNKPGEMALKFALTMSLPVFATAEKEVINWSAESATLAQESLHIKVNNHGNSHLMVNKIKVTGLDANGQEVFAQDATGWYTLAGRSRTYTVNVPYQHCLRATRINVALESKESVKQMEMAVTKAMCTRKPDVAANAGKTMPPKLRQ